MSSSSPTHAVRRDSVVLGLFGASFLAAHQVGLRLITPDNPLSPVWLPSGVMLGGFILLPRRLWWHALAAIVVADVISNEWAGVRMWVGLAYLLASLIELAVALRIMHWLGALELTFRRVRDTFALLLAAAAGAAASGLLAGVIATQTTNATFAPSFQTWFTADVLGMLLLTPLLVSWARGEWNDSLSWRQALEGVGFMAFWSWASYRIFRGDLTIGWLMPHPYMLASLMVWAAFRLGIRGVSTAMSTVAAVAISVVLTGTRVFPLGGATLSEQLLLVQVFLVVMGVTGLLLASALAEGRTATDVARENADRLRVLGDNLPNGVIYQVVRELDGRMRFLHVSAGVERLNGVRAEDAMRDPDVMYAQLRPDERRRIAAAEQASARDLSVFSVETPLRRADGTERWVMISSTPRRLEDGRVVWDGVQMDITERREAEVRLRRANRALRTISNGNQVLVRATTEFELLRDICHVIVSDGGYRLAWVGYAARDEQRHVRPAAHAGYEEGYLESLDITWADDERGRGPTGTAIREGRVVVCQDFLNDTTVLPWRDDAIRRGYRASIVLPLRDGVTVFGALSVYAPEAGAFDAEEIALLTELADDLAYGILALRAREEHARAETALAASEERFRQLAENIREIFWMVDTSTGALLYTSPGIERLWGASEAELRADPLVWFKRIHPEDADRVWRASRDVRAGGEYDLEYRVVHPDGSHFWIHDRAFPVRDASGQVYRVVGVADDITARKRIEEQLRQVQKLEAIGQLAGGIAHDFNNILAAIMMQTGMARAIPGIPPDVAELLQDVEASSQRAANLTRQLLVFSRKQVMQERQVDVNDLVTDLARMLRRVVPENVHLQLVMHPRRLLAHADPGMLEQVVVNLTVNARDAMPDGGQLSIETFARDLSAADVRAFNGARPGPFVGVRVQDTGGGISTEHLPHIFEPFFTTKEPGKGTGLGLATVYGIVQQHHGVITVESVVGRGTTVEVLLPSLDVPTPMTAPALPPALPHVHGEGQTILVVEDDPTVRAMTRRVLERNGYRVHTARSGREALRDWDTYVPPADLLLTDMVMPEGVGGSELASALQQRRPGLRVIFSSGYDPDHDTHRVRLEPGVNFLQKPSTPRQILDLVNQMFERHLS